MPSQETAQQLEEAQIQHLERQQKIFDAYAMVFGSEAGRAVLENMRERAFYNKSTFEGDGRNNRGLRDCREGQRNFHMVTEDFIGKGHRGVKPPPQTHAISRTARDI